MLARVVSAAPEPGDDRPVVRLVIEADGELHTFRLSLPQAEHASWLLTRAAVDGWWDYLHGKHEKEMA